MQAEDIIRPISHNDMNKWEAEVLKKAVDKIKKKQEKEFLEHLDKASKIVDGWPEWKQNALGTLRM